MNVCVVFRIVGSPFFSISLAFYERALRTAAYKSFQTGPKTRTLQSRSLLASERVLIITVLIEGLEFP